MINCIYDQNNNSIYPMGKMTLHFPDDSSTSKYKGTVKEAKCWRNSSAEKKILV